MDEFYEVAQMLPGWLAQPLQRIPADLAQQVHEIRLRLDCCPAFTVSGHAYSAARWPALRHEMDDLILDRERLEECFYTLCGGSVHTYQPELAQGFFTLPGGHRTGVGGRFLSTPQQGVTLQTLTSLDLRIARARPVILPQELQTALTEHFTGLIVAGEPGSGKTTLLREIARFLAEQNRLVAVIDEREELLGPAGTVAPAKGIGLDRISGLDKQTALTMALRTLGPQIILLDELGDLSEVRVLEQGFFSGVDFIASLHARDKSDALRRPQVERLRRHGMLRVLVTLCGRQTPGKIREVTFF